MSNSYDVIVVGGGASGMMAAGRAAERGKRVLLLEKNKVLGKKLSITGGGRCNILNAEPDTRALLANYGDKAKFLYSPFSKHGMQDSWNFFTDRGLPLVVEARKRAFPQSMKATDVTNVMYQYLIDNRVEIKTGFSVKDILFENSRVCGVCVNKNEIFTANSYILSTGGVSHPATGATGDLFDSLAHVGYTVHKSNPSIVPLTVSEDWVKDLSGTTLSFMKITFGVDISKENKESIGRFSRTGKILFTHFGVSGPLILNSASKVLKLLEKNNVVKCSIDLYPDTEAHKIHNRVLELFLANKNKLFKTVVKDLVPTGMSEAVLRNCPEHIINTPVHSITKTERQNFAELLKNMPLTVTGTMGLDWAVISDGGVDLKDIYTNNMQSRLHDNLYFTGDMLHINRPSGGYSLQLCWTTGWVAGSDV